MIEWQPIETAPLDGTSVLLWLPKPWFRCARAQYFARWRTWVDEAPECPAREEIYGIGELVPTHWMHLPEAPSND